MQNFVINFPVQKSLSGKILLRKVLAKILLPNEILKFGDHQYL